MSAPSLTYLERGAASDAAGAVLAYLESSASDKRAMARHSAALMAKWREAKGMAPRAVPLLTGPGAQPKTGKNRIPTYTLMLAPARTAKLARVNLCPAASAGCELACLNTAGRGGMSTVQTGRVLRTDLLVESPHLFGARLAHEITLASKRGNIGLRLNCLSDIRWEIIAPDMIRAISALGVSLYDYTAYAPARRANAVLPYHLTYSAKEHHSVEDIRALIDSGHSVAVPFKVRKRAPMPTSWHGMPVIDGDLTDYRPDDPAGVIVGLRAKGRGKSDNSGFVRAVGKSS